MCFFCIMLHRYCGVWAVLNDINRLFLHAVLRSPVMRSHVHCLHKLGFFNCVASECVCNSRSDVVYVTKAWNQLFYKLFKVSKQACINDMQMYFGIKSVDDELCSRRDRFLKTLTSSTNTVLGFYRAACNADAVLWWEFCPSVRLSLCHTHGLWQNGRKIGPDFQTIRKNI